jgi:tetratricopeptide (TPR) repeat protein
VSQRAPALALGLLLVLAVAQCGKSREDSQRHFLSTQRYEDVYYLPPPDWLEVFSLGHREALAGLIWLRALVYFGEEIVHRGPSAHLTEYAEAMLRLDPWFKRVYHWIAINSVYRLGKVSREHVQTAIDYLDRGARLFPDDGELAWDLAAFYLYELRPYLKGAEREEATRKGNEHLRVAILRGTGPVWLALTAASELEKLGQIEHQIAYLQDVYAHTSDEPTREAIRRRMAKLRDRGFAEAFERAEEDLQAARARSFPYLETELFVHVGAKPAFDGKALLLRGFDPEPLSHGEEP